MNYKQKEIIIGSIRRIMDLELEKEESIKSLKKCLKRETKDLMKLNKQREDLEEGLV